MWLRILGFLAISIPLSPAQQPTRISASFYAFEYAAGDESVFFRAGPEAYGEVVLSKANIVGPVAALLVNGSIHLHGEEVTAPNGDIDHPVVASAKVPAGARRVLVVLFPNPPDSSPAYKSLVFEHNDRNFPLGTYRIINLSPNPVRGAMGRQIVTARPGAVANIRLEGAPGSIVPVRFEYSENGQWNLLTATRAAVRKDRRWLMCVYKDPVSGRYNMRSIPDRTTDRPPPRAQ